MTLTEASAMKLYSARSAMEVALEAVQIFGGNGYMSEYEVEQLARDAKVPRSTRAPTRSRSARSPATSWPDPRGPQATLAGGR
jgi:hypothetical protein